MHGVAGETDRREGTFTFSPSADYKGKVNVGHVCKSATPPGHQISDGWSERRGTEELVLSMTCGEKGK